MQPFTVEYSKLTLEGMRMEQSTLNLLITLSSGALTLYFSFIDKLAFVGLLRYAAVAAPLFWICSLILALLAHNQLTSLWLMLCRFSALSEESHKKLDDYGDYVSKSAATLKEMSDSMSAEDVEKLMSENRERRDEMLKVQDDYNKRTEAFGSKYFPMQTRQINLVFYSMGSFALAFVIVLGCYLGNLIVT